MALGALLTSIHGLTFAIQDNYWKLMCLWVTWNNLDSTVLCNQWCSHAKPTNTHTDVHVRTRTHKHTHSLPLQTL